MKENDKKSIDVRRTGPRELEVRSMIETRAVDKIEIVGLEEGCDKATARDGIQQHGERLGDLVLFRDHLATVTGLSGCRLCDGEVMDSRNGIPGVN